MTLNTAIDYEAEYNNRKRVPEHVGINERWSMLIKSASRRRSVSWRQSALPSSVTLRAVPDRSSPVSAWVSCWADG